MPELPDVEIFRCRLDEAIAKHITDARVKDARLLDGISARELERRLAGRRITDTRRHGKYLIANLDDGAALILHFGMTGALETARRGAPPPKFEVLHMDLGKDLWVSVTSRRKLGHIWLTDDVAGFLRQHNQGPDALDEALDCQAFAAALGSARGTLKGCLMDQSRIAGIGNIYSDEILLQARLHPLTRVSDLGRDELARLYRLARKVLRRAIARKVMAEGPASEFPRTWLSAHRVKGGTCPRCGSTLAMLSIGGRTSYLCPRCQGKPPTGR